jgi:DNA-binding transcriptional LysR family regulator
MNLEDELGIKIFNRSNHHIILTEDGQLFQRRAEEIVNLMEKTKNELSSESELAGEIVIGSGEFPSFSWMCEKMRKFQIVHPNVKFNVITNDADHIKSDIENGNIDIGILLDPVNIDKFDFISLPQKNEWGFVVKKDSRLAKQGYIKPKDIKSERILISKRTLIQEQLARWAGISVDQLNISGYNNLSENGIKMVLHEIGITFGLKTEIPHKDLVFIPMKPSLMTGTVAVWKRNVPFSATVKEFISFITAKE